MMMMTIDLEQKCIPFMTWWLSCVSLPSFPSMSFMIHTWYLGPKLTFVYNACLMKCSLFHPPVIQTWVNFIDYVSSLFSLTAAVIPFLDSFVRFSVSLMMLKTTSSSSDHENRGEKLYERKRFSCHLLVTLMLPSSRFFLSLWKKKCW